jgi:hypothetical protein
MWEGVQVAGDAGGNRGIEHVTWCSAMGYKCEGRGCKWLSHSEVGRQPLAGD